MPRLVFLIPLVILTTGCGRDKPTLKDVDNASSQLLVQSCFGCHYQSNFMAPEINGLSRRELEASLKNYKMQSDGESVMHRLMRGYSDKDITKIAKTLGQDE